MRAPGTAFSATPIISPGWYVFGVTDAKSNEPVNRSCRVPPGAARLAEVGPGGRPVTLESPQPLGVLGQTTRLSQLVDATGTGSITLYW